MCRISGEDIVDNGGVKLKFTRKNLCIPYVVYLVLFVALPLIVLFYYAFTDGTGQFTVQNLTGFFTDPNAIGTLLYSFAVAIVTTAVCLLLAYPIAYILAMYPFLNAVIGMTYDFLPFMILPIYTTISKLDGALREAAMDLGANERETFLRVTLPLSMPGIMSGISMVFLPAMTNYVVLDMLYNSTYIMGSLIGSYFAAYNWHGGSMIALILLAIICLFTLLTDDDQGEVQRGGALL